MPCSTRIFSVYTSLLNEIILKVRCPTATKSIQLSSPILHQLEPEVHLGLVIGAPLELTLETKASVWVTSGTHLVSSALRSSHHPQHRSIGPYATWSTWPYVATHAMTVVRCPPLSSIVRSAAAKFSSDSCHHTSEGHSCSGRMMHGSRKELHWDAIAIVWLSESSPNPRVAHHFPYIYIYTHICIHITYDICV